MPVARLTLGHRMVRVLHEEIPWSCLNSIAGARSVHYNRQGMKLRFHLLACLLAVLAFTATAVDGLWAAAERAEMGTGMVASALADGGAPSTEDCSVEMARVDYDCFRGGSPGAPQCPSMPLGMASSCASGVALPAEWFPHLEPAPEGTPSLRSLDQTRDLLLVLAFFRPPIA